MVTKVPPTSNGKNVLREKRARPLPSQWAVVSKRSLPAFYVVDETLRVLNFHIDRSSREQRADCKFDARTHALPELVGNTVRSLAERRQLENCADQTLVALPNPSMVVSAVWLEGQRRNNIAVFVERFKARNYVNQATERYALSKREEDVLELLVRGARTSEIAKSLFIAPTTVIYHLNSLMVKTDSHNRTEIVSKALA
ncbi:MAG: helix-turn-helix transcriptional regulator [Candidatus Eremiobacteraeota bacterium]|nr:helix-turn-helix transcriptional regulator [Candidatus Eremiobacteraeota bacterium]